MDAATVGCDSEVLSVGEKGRGRRREGRGRRRGDAESRGLRGGRVGGICVGDHMDGCEAREWYRK
jgi:hypothetical protein